MTAISATPLVLFWAIALVIVKHATQEVNIWKCPLKKLFPLYYFKVLWKLAIFNSLFKRPTNNSLDTIPSLPTVPRLHVIWHPLELQLQTWLRSEHC